MNNRLCTLWLYNKGIFRTRKRNPEKSHYYMNVLRLVEYMYIYTGATCTLLHCFLKKSHLNSWKMSISYRELEFPYFLFSFHRNLEMLVIDWIILYLRMICTIIKLFTLRYSMMNFNMLEALFRFCFFCFNDLITTNVGTILMLTASTNSGKNTLYESVK